MYVQDSRLGAGDLASLERPSPSPPAASSVPLAQATGIGSGNPRTVPPDLILITSWTGAAPKYVAKYTASHNALYPGVPILVITTSATDLVIRSTSQNIEALGPAVKYLLSRETAPATATSPGLIRHDYSSHRRPQAEPPSEPRFSSILLHAFSEGGGYKAVCLAHAYLGSTNRASRLPIAALILDSTPGTPRPRNLAIGLRQALPNSRSGPIVTALCTALSAGVVWLAWAAVQLRRHTSEDGEQDFISQTRKALNDEQLWGDLRGISRTYLFGEGDEIIWWGDVHSHGVESAMANKGGVGSLMVRFKETGHCAHVREERNRSIYWAAVKKTWESRQDGGLGFNLGLSRPLSLDSLCHLGDN